MDLNLDEVEGAACGAVGVDAVAVVDAAVAGAVEALSTLFPGDIAALVGAGPGEGENAITVVDEVEVAVFGAVGGAVDWRNVGAGDGDFRDVGTRATARRTPLRNGIRGRRRAIC